MGTQIELVIAQQLIEKGWTRQNNRLFNKNGKTILIVDQDFVKVSLGAVHIGMHRTGEVLDASNKLLQYFIAY